MARLTKKSATPASTSAREDREAPLAYINVGRQVPRNDGEGEYMVSPFFGLAIEAEPAKKRLSATEKKLHAAIMKKVEALIAAGEYGSHAIKLDVELYIPDPEAKQDVDTSDFDDL